MPRPKLSNVPLAALRAEIDRRMKALKDLVAKRDALNKQIAELEAFSGERIQKAPEARKRREARRKRRHFSQTAEEMILGLLKGGRALTTAKINVAWKKAGRAASADATLGQLVKAGKLRREKVKKGKGSNYSLA